MKSYGGALTGFLCLSLATLPQALLLLVKSTCGQAHSLGSHILYHKKKTGENKECAVSRRQGQSRSHISHPKRGEEIRQLWSLLEPYFSVQPDLLVSVSVCLRLLALKIQCAWLEVD